MVMCASIKCKRDSVSLQHAGLAKIVRLLPVKDRLARGGTGWAILDVQVSALRFRPELLRVAVVDGRYI